MGRVALVGILILIAPTLLWVGWQYRKRGLRPVGFLRQRLRDAPWPTLVGIGLALSIGALLVTGSFDKESCERVPSQFVDGKLVEAHCR